MQLGAGWVKGAKGGRPPRPRPGQGHKVHHRSGPRTRVQGKAAPAALETPEGVGRRGGLERELPGPQSPGAKPPRYCAPQDHCKRAAPRDLIARAAPPAERGEEGQHPRVTGAEVPPRPPCLHTGAKGLHAPAPPRVQLRRLVTHHWAHKQPRPPLTGHPRHRGGRDYQGPSSPPVTRTGTGGWSWQYAKVSPPSGPLT